MTSELASLSCTQSACVHGQGGAFSLSSSAGDLRPGYEGRSAPS